MSRAAQIQAQAADWLARRDGEQWSDAKQEELDQWIAASTAHRIAYLRVSSAWQRADRLGSLHVPGRTSVRSVAGRFTLARLAGQRTAVALALTVVVLALGGFVAAPGMLHRSTSYVTAVGESRTLPLLDGSRLTLNTATHVRTRIAQAGRDREVWLDNGEAYFEVAHDASRPFVVYAGATRVTVLGTRFAVRRDGDQVQVTVVDGRVQVRAANAAGADANVLLTRNDSAVVGGEGLQLAHRSAGQVDSQLSWRQGKLILDHMTLAQAAAEFNRYNVRKLVITDPAVGRILIGGSFNIDNIDGFARLLQQGFGVKAQAGKDDIKISR